MGIIYKATNIVNNKSYIGLTKNSLQDRKYQHLYYAEHGKDTHFCRALRKYGEHSFEWSILENVSNDEELGSREVYYINLFDTFNNGYNSTSGGESGYTFTYEHKQAASERQSGSNNSFFGKTHTSEVKEMARKNIIIYNKSNKRRKKMSENQSGKRVKAFDDYNEAKKIKIDVYLYDTGEFVCTYDTVSECAIACNTCRSSIAKVIQGKLKQSKGFKFKNHE